MAANSSFTTALLSFGFFNYICLGIYKSAIYFISIFFFASAFIFLKIFFSCLVFLFIHYSSVTSFLDLVAWFLNSLGELNLFQKFKNLIFLGELNLCQESEFHVDFFYYTTFLYFFCEGFSLEWLVACWIIPSFFLQFFIRLLFCFCTCLRGSVFWVLNPALIFSRPLSRIVWACAHDDAFISSWFDLLELTGSRHLCLFVG